LVAKISRSRFKVKYTFIQQRNAKLILDSGKIEEEAERANKEKYSKHEVAEPLYNVEQARKVFPHLK
jgi:metallo-beta-lactamase family protein